MLTKLLPQFTRINNHVVEPNQELLVQYKALTQEEADQLQGVSFNWHQQTLEQYEKAGDLTKFHFVSSVHSLYYVDDVERSLMHMYNLLDPGGVMLVIVLSDNSGLWRLWNHFPCFQENLMRFISSANIRSHLDRRIIPYTQYHHPFRMPITKCFDEASEDGKMLLDFFIHILKFKETAPEDLFLEVMAYIAGENCSEKSGDEILFNNDWDAVVVSKPLA